LNDLFSLQPHVLLLSTALDTHEKQGWWYLMSESGQHLFFYGKNALEKIVKKYHYDFIISGGLILFVKNISMIRKIMLETLLKNVVLRLLKSFILFLPTLSVWKNHVLHLEKAKKDHKK
jgi:hypothetical protein